MKLVSDLITNEKYHNVISHRTGKRNLLANCGNIGIVVRKECLRSDRLMYQYILFDLDGTLTDPKIGITTCVQYALHKMGIEEPDLDKLEPFIGPPLTDSFCDFYGMDNQKAGQAVVYYRERFSTVGLFENEVYPGIPQMLEALKEAGKKLAIASSKPTVFVKQILEHFEICQYFDVIVGSEIDGTRSRKEEVVEEALRQLLPGMRYNQLRKGNIALTKGGQADCEIVMVGDRRFDIEGAKEYGIVSIGVAYGYAEEGELAEAGADIIVGTVEDLKKVLLFS